MTMEHQNNNNYIYNNVFCTIFKNFKSNTKILH